jgi:hypothetical protein
VVPGRVVGVQVPEAGHVLEGRDQGLQLAVLVLLQIVSCRERREGVIY